MLDDRKITILTEIVDYYINLAEPIGSRTLSKNPLIGLSSATIRNEMSDLEELGYLTKTHVSSGRIPSDKAYRMYVNMMLEDGVKLNEKYVSSLTETLTNDSTSLQELYETANRMLSEKTNYVTVIVLPTADSFTVEYVKLEYLGNNRLLLVFVGRNGETGSYILNNVRISDGDLEILETNIKKLIIGKDEKDLSESLDSISKEDSRMDIYRQIILVAIEFLKRKNTYNVFLNGIGNIINFGEEDPEFIKGLIDYLENDENLVDVSLKREIEKILDFRIGGENEDEMFKNSSIIRTKYEGSRGEMGNITLIGPTRMDYRKLANILFNFSITLSNL